VKAPVLALCLVLALVLAPGPAAGALAGPATQQALWRSDWYGATVVSVAFRGDAPIDESYASRIVTLRKGAVLTDAAVRESIRNLFATQWFSDLWVEVGRVEGNGVVVVVGYSAAPRIRSLAVEGPGIPSTSSLKDAIGLARGDFWDSDRGRAAEQAAERFLHERGLFEAHVRTGVELRPDGASVDVTFVVEVGPVAVTGPAELSGDMGPVALADLARAARLKPGRPYRHAAARRDAEAYAAFLRSKGFARAEVRFENEAYDARRRVATPTYAVFVGPRLVLEVDGANEKDIRTHPAAPWAKGSPPDEESIRKFASVLKQGYQEKGLARAEVSVAFRSSPGEEIVSFRIRGGDRYAVSAVSVAGNGSIPSREILPLLATSARGMATTGRVVDAVLAADRGTIEALYRSRGYTKVKTGEPVVSPGRGPFTLDVTFPVEEGARSIVGDRVVEGAVATPLRELESRLVVRTGQPFRPSDVDSDVATIRSVLADRGFALSRVDAVVTPLEGVPDAPGRVAVRYKLFEGDELVVGKTIVRGNRVTRIAEIEREFTFHEGDPLSYAKVAETEQKLARLGIFQRIDMTSLTATPGSNRIPLLLTVSETKPWSLLYGLGAEYDPSVERRVNPRLSLGVSYYNLFGGAITTSFEARYSQRDSRLVVTARKRSIFETFGPAAFTIYRADQTQPTYSVYRVGTYFEVEKKLAEKTRVTFRYQYEIVTPTADDPSIIGGIDRQDQPIRISSLGAALIRDTRDDPAAPKTGWFLLADTKWAFPLFQADAKFLKVLGQAARFFPAGRTVVATSLRLGAIASFAECDPAANPACLPNLEVPINERIFAGGRTTHRAFPLDNLGIEGQTLKSGTGIGGNALVLANVEWRFPVLGDLGMTIFVDAGNVWASPDRVRFSEIRYGTGLGLSFMTPVGPLRLEYGMKLDRQPGEDAGAFNFSIGYPF
jgi:outer membrane protein insertion porin family